MWVSTAWADWRDTPYSVEQPPKKTKIRFICKTSKKKTPCFGTKIVPKQGEACVSFPFRSSCDCLWKFLRFSYRGRVTVKGDLFLGALGGDGTAVGLHNLLGDGQTQPGIAGMGAAGGVQPEKLLKHAGELFRRNGGARVAEGDGHPPVVLLRR